MSETYLCLLRVRLAYIRSFVFVDKSKPDANSETASVQTVLLVFATPNAGMLGT